MNHLVIFFLLVLASGAFGACLQSGSFCSVSQQPCLLEKTSSASGVPSESIIYFPPRTSYYTDFVQLSTPIKGQVLILQDTGPGVDAGDLSSVSNTLQAFYNYLRAKWGSMEIAFATFDEDANSYRPRSSFSTDVSNRGYLKTSIDTVGAPLPKSDSPSMPNGAVLDAIIDASSDINLGWKDGYSKIIVVLTRYGYPMDAGFLTESQYNTELLKRGVLPVYCSKQLSNPGKQQFYLLQAQTGVGSVGSGKTPAHNILNGDQGNWNELGKHGIESIIGDYYGNSSSVRWTVLEGQEYVDSISIDSTFKVNITYKWESPSADVEPLVVINFIGYGTVTAHLKTNKRPYLTSADLIVEQGQSVTGFVLAGDDDGNLLSDVTFAGPAGGNAIWITTTTNDAGIRVWSFVVHAVGDAGSYEAPISTNDGCFATDNVVTIRVTANPPVSEPTSAPISQPTSVPSSAPVTTPISEPVAVPVSEPTPEPVPVPVSLEPPSSEHQLLYTRQNVPVSGHLTATGSEPIRATIQLLPGFKGQLLDSSTNLVISDGYELGSHRNFTYIPPADSASPDNQTPFARFFFKVVDGTGLSSALYRVSIIVLPDLTGGSKVINIDEDSQVLISLLPTDAFKTDPTANIDVSIDDIQGTFKSCLAIDHCDDTLLTTGGSTLPGSSMVHFTPDANTHGSPYATFAYKLTSGGEHPMTSTYVVTINVLPVNDPPSIVPRFGKRVTIRANESLPIEWDGFDIDDKRETLIGQISYLPNRGSLYRVNGDGSKGSEIVLADTAVLPSSPGFFRTLFVPTPGTAGNSYATIGVLVMDPHRARSRSETITISVAPINRPPIISEAGPFRVPVSSAFVIPDVSVSDPDINNFDMRLEVTFPDQIQFVVAEKCQASGQSVVCVGPQNWINAVLRAIQISSNVTGDYIVDYVIDDLNNGGPRSDRGLPGLTDRTQVTISVIPPSTAVDLKDDHTLTIAVSVSVVGAAALLALGAGLLARKLKKAAPSDDYFSFMNDPNSDARLNPLYEAQFQERSNPMYTSK
jgi:hypothetical protein